MAVGRVARVGLERCRHGIDGLALLGFPHARRRWDPQRLARFAHLVRRHRPYQHRHSAASGAPRRLGAARPARHRSVAVRASNRRRPRLRLDRLVPLEWPNWLAEWCRRDECRRSSSTRAPSRWPGGPRRSTTRSLNCSLPSTWPSRPSARPDRATTRAKIFELMVDGVARSYLFQGGWKADIGRGRKLDPGAASGLRRALRSPITSSAVERPNSTSRSASSATSSIAIDADCRANRSSSHGSDYHVARPPRPVGSTARTRRRHRLDAFVHRH